MIFCIFLFTVRYQVALEVIAKDTKTVTDAGFRPEYQADDVEEPAATKTIHVIKEHEPAEEKNKRKVPAADFGPYCVRTAAQVQLKFALFLAHPDRVFPTLNSATGFANFPVDEDYVSINNHFS